MKLLKKMLGIVAMAAICCTMTTTPSVKAMAGTTCLAHRYVMTRKIYVTYTEQHVGTRDYGDEVTHEVCTVVTTVNYDLLKCYYCGDVIETFFLGTKKTHSYCLDNK